jgi:hypothetical protein
MRQKELLYLVGSFLFVVLFFDEDEISLQFLHTVCIEVR